ncbi:MAG: LEPR-XLL domain-containing protein, partial [bacterium]
MASLQFSAASRNPFAANVREPRAGRPAFIRWRDPRSSSSRMALARSLTYPRKRKTPELGTRLEPIEPRFLLAADLPIPVEVKGPADSMLEDFQDRFDEVLADSDSFLSKPVPFLLVDDPANENLGAKTPTMLDTLRIRVDFDQNGEIENQPDINENRLQEIDQAEGIGDDDGFVDGSELYEFFITAELDKFFASLTDAESDT